MCVLNYLIPLAEKYHVKKENKKFTENGALK